MKKPRDRMHRGRLCLCSDRMGGWFEVPIANRITGQPREWRKAAKWLRQVADWWDYLADKQEAATPREG